MIKAADEVLGIRKKYSKRGLRMLRDFRAVVEKDAASTIVGFWLQHARQV
jgi:hypothetical protein